MTAALVIYAGGFGIVFAVAYVFGRMLQSTGLALWVPALFIALLWPLTALAALAVWSRDRISGWIEQ